MYSVVLLVAMSGTADTPAGLLGRHGGGGGCYGGCSGGGHGRKHRGFGRRRHGCSGGGCNGGGCNGGGCYGGGCYGGMPVGGCYGGMPIIGGMKPPGGGDMKGDKDKGSGDNKDKDKGKNKGNKNDDNKNDDQEVRTSAPATIVVSLPAEAKLTVDGTATKSTSAQRTFTTPALSPARDFYYTFRATIVREGRPISAEQRVRVRAGQKTPVRFDFATTGVALNK
jgi:uncharacterized protein (TIGR03000 family)